MFFLYVQPWRRLHLHHNNLQHFGVTGFVRLILILFRNKRFIDTLRASTEILHRKISDFPLILARCSPCSSRKSGCYFTSSWWYRWHSIRWLSKLLNMHWDVFRRRCIKICISLSCVCTRMCHRCQGKICYYAKYLE